MAVKAEGCGAMPRSRAGNARLPSKFDASTLPSTLLATAAVPPLTRRRLSDKIWWVLRPEANRAVVHAARPCAR